MSKRNNNTYVDHGYDHRVRIGNWFEAQVLDECKKKNLGNRDRSGNSMLAKYRNVEKNLNSPTELTACAGNVAFGARIMMLAPHVPNCYPPEEGKNGLCLAGRIPFDKIEVSQELRDGCSVVGLAKLAPVERNTFVITSPDYCAREGELLKYNQQFLLALSSSLSKKPLYIRYDPQPVPGCCGKFPIYLSKHSTSNARWRVLPVQRPDLTRFEQEGRPIPANADVIINHCATNINLGINTRVWGQGIFKKNYAPLMKTCLGVTGKELPYNIWQILCVVNTTSIPIS